MVCNYISRFFIQSELIYNKNKIIQLKKGLFCCEIDLPCDNCIQSTGTILVDLIKEKLTIFGATKEYIENGNDYTKTLIYDINFKEYEKLLDFIFEKNILPIGNN